MSDLLTTSGTLSDVLITEELSSRASRPPDYEAQAQALEALAGDLATDPRGLLQKVVNTVLSLCRADSAGVSILEADGAEGIFCWHAVAGEFSIHLNGTMPRAWSPCGDVIARNAVLLFDRAERHYPAMRGVGTPIFESLLAPWEVNGEAVGTLWAVGHTPDRRFDAEDARLLSSLARFAAAAWQTVVALDAATLKRQDLERDVETRAREAAEVLRRSEARLQLAVDAAALGTFVWHVQEDRSEPDARMLALFGLPLGATLSLREALASLIHPHDRTHYAEAVARATQAGGLGVLREEVRVRRPDGEERWLAITAQTFFDSATGHATHMAGMAADVTDRKRTEDSLRENESRQSFLVRLSDALRSVGEPVEAEAVACRLLAEQLDADRVLYADVAPDEQSAVVDACYARPGLPSLGGVHEIGTLTAGATAQLQAGHPRVVNDCGDLSSLTPDERAACRALGIAACVIDPS